MIGLDSLSPKYGSTSKKKRLGCGRGSGHGETSTRGQKGQSARSGGTKKPGFEGGQMPLFRRIPKSGFSNVRFATNCECVNLSSLCKLFPANAEVTVKALKSKGLISCGERVKVLSNGDMSHPLKISVHAFSKGAKAKIEKAGGKALELGAKK